MVRSLFGLLFIFALLQFSCKDVKGIHESDNHNLNRDSIDGIINDTILKNMPKNIRELYSMFDDTLIWRVSQNRENLFLAIKNCSSDGLFPENYELGKLLNYEKKIDDLTYYELQQFDILLTKVFKNLANHLHRGIINPRNLYTNWDAHYRNPVYNKQIAAAIVSNKIQELLDKVKADNPNYLAIKQQYELFKNLPDDVFEPLQTGKIYPLSSSSIVPLLKKKLYGFGYLKTNDGSTFYDNETVNALKFFQKSHGLLDDGIIGAGTLKELNTTRSKRLRQILIGMERAKWYPDVFAENFIYVNIPDMKLVFMFEGDTIDEKRVVIGTIKRKTPVVTSRIGNLVFYPTWTLPPTIIKEDLTKDATKNKNYFNAMRITIKDNKGNIINPKDWDTLNAYKYKYIQAPGYHNALGLVKFNFHNKFSVYLHDTNHREYFSKTNRALSSGCVRVENPLELSQKILLKEDEEKWKNGEVDSIIKRGTTKTVYLRNQIKVYQFYHTCWAQNNVLNTRKDVYDYDEDLYSKMRSQFASKTNF